VPRKLCTEDFIKKAIKVHGNRYDYSKVNYINNRIKVIIICSKHGEFEQLPSSHLCKKPKGCGKCGNINGGLSLRMGLDNFIKKSLIVHGNKYNYSKAKYVNNNTKITIICPKHGEFKQAPGSHLVGQGCPKCGQNLPTIDEFIEKANKKHHDKYDYSRVKYERVIDKIVIICPEHGEFKQSVFRHLSGQGCRKCKKCAKLTLDDFIERSNATHNNKYDYSKSIYINSHKNVIIICPIHGEFVQSPRAHMSGQNCPKCSNSGRSKMASKWLDDINIFEREVTVNLKIGDRVIVDGFDKQKNIVYEFFGDFWHGNPDVYNLDDINPRTHCKFGHLYDETIIRAKNIVADGYNIIYKWETDFNMGIGEKYEKE